MFCDIIYSLLKGEGYMLAKIRDKKLFLPFMRKTRIKKYSSSQVSVMKYNYLVW